MSDQRPQIARMHSLRTAFFEASRTDFLNGWFYIENSSTLYRMRGWPRLIAQQRGADGSWKPMAMGFRNELRLEELFRQDEPVERWVEVVSGSPHYYDFDQMLIPSALDEAERNLAHACYHYQCFLRSVPLTIANAALGLRCDLLSALQLMTEAPAALELVETGPNLATALARHWDFPSVDRMDWSAVRDFLQRPRREIIAWLGYPSSEAIVKALERVQTPYDVHSIRRCLAAMVDRYAGPIVLKLPFIDEEVASFLLNPLSKSWLRPEQAMKMGPRLNSAAWSLFGAINRLLEYDLIDMASARRLSTLSVRRFSSRNFLPYIGSRSLPSGPCPSQPAIEALESVQQLIAEGEAMGTCVGSVDYCIRALTGEIAVYQVIWPTRATLCLCRRGADWAVEELKGSGNSDVLPEHAELIAQAFPAVAEWEPWVNRDQIDARRILLD